MKSNNLWGIKSNYKFGSTLEKKITKYFIKSNFVLLKSGKICYSNFQNVFLNIMHIYFRERIIVIFKKKKERLIHFSNEWSGKQRGKVTSVSQEMCLCVYIYMHISHYITLQVTRKPGQNGTLRGRAASQREREVRCWAFNTLLGREWESGATKTMLKSAVLF